ncbi:MAG: hypothetical protein AAGH76_05930 [Pseudomonadota bacterium]
MLLQRMLHTCRGKRLGSALAGFAIGFMFYTIIAPADAGGIWDGYVPAWLSTPLEEVR